MPKKAMYVHMYYLSPSQMLTMIQRLPYSGFDPEWCPGTRVPSCFCIQIKLTMRRRRNEASS